MIDRFRVDSKGFRLHHQDESAPLQKPPFFKGNRYRP